MSTKFTSQEIEDAKTLYRLIGLKEIYRDGALIAVDNDLNEVCLDIEQFPSIEKNRNYTYKQIIGGNE